MTESPNTGCSQTNRVLTTLANLDIRHEIIECDPELSDTQIFCEHYGYSLEQSANVIVAVGKSDTRQYAACVLLATTRLDINRCVRKRMGVRRASFASPEETQSLTGMEIGGVTALGLPESLPIWVDQRVMEQELIILGGGSRSIKVKISPSVFERIDNATVVENLASLPD